MSDLLKDPSWRAGAQAMLDAMIDRRKLMPTAVRNLLERLEALAGKTDDETTTTALRDAVAAIHTQDKRIAELEHPALRATEKKEGRK